MNTNTQIAIIGLGYVGLPNLINYCTKGYHVTGIDIDECKIQSLNKGISYIEDISNETLKQYRHQMTLSTDSSLLSKQDYIFIDVPTPISKSNEPDLSYVKCAIDHVLTHVQKGQTIVLESTVAPTTSDSLLVKPLEAMGFEIGRDVYVAYSPERVDPGNTSYNHHHIARVVGGHTEACLKRAVDIIGDLAYPVSSMEVAEISKLYENTFRFVNISLANEIARITEAMDIGFKEVMDAAASKPFGFMPFHPSIGIGGHCIPIDPYYLTHFAKGLDVETPLIDIAAFVNDGMLESFIIKVMENLNKQGLPFINSKIAILGAAYKPNVSDMRMAVSHALVDQLEHYGSNVSVYDDLAQATPVGTRGLSVQKLDYIELTHADLIIINTQHDGVNYPKIHDLCKNVIYAGDFGGSSAQ